MPLVVFLLPLQDMFRNLNVAKMEMELQLFSFAI